MSRSPESTSPSKSSALSDLSDLSDPSVLSEFSDPDRPLENESSTPASPVSAAFSPDSKEALRKAPSGVRESIRSFLLRQKSALQNPPPTRTFALGSWLFLRGMGLVYLFAFASLWSQFEGLFGSGGLLPVAEYLELIESRLPDTRFRIAPTLAWINPSDGFLNLMCGAGVVAAVMATLGVLQLPAFALMWLLYLSLAVAGQDFFRFQWDSLLLEAGLLTLLLAPWTLAPKGPRRLRASGRIARLLLVFLLFKLMFLSGLVKLLSGDETWRTLGALHIHYQTQPLPNGLSWWAHHLPGWMHKTGVAATLAIELVFPFFVFGPWLLRRLAFFAFVGLMLLIGLTGNYGFFNLLSVVLCLLIADDALFGRLLPRRVMRVVFEGRTTESEEAVASSASGSAGARPSAFAKEQSQPLFSLPQTRALAWWIVAPLALVLLQQSAMKLSDRARVEFPWPKFTRSLEEKLQPLRSINSYGLFASMTTRRPEIILEGSNDGQEWLAYELHWKPGDPHSRPRFAGPHMPRLDWQLWFAALGNVQRNPWVLRYMDQLLEGSPTALDFIRHNPFPQTPPRFVRAVLYEYRYSQDLAQGYWERELLGLYARPRDLGRRVGVP